MTITIRLSDEKAQSIITEGLKTTGAKNAAAYLTLLVRKFGTKLNKEFDEPEAGNQKASRRNRKPKSTTQSLAFSQTTIPQYPQDEMYQGNGSGNASLPSMLEMM
jgi:hypothetical protein